NCPVEVGPHLLRSPETMEFPTCKAGRRLSRAGPNSFRSTSGTNSRASKKAAVFLLTTGAKRQQPRTQDRPLQIFTQTNTMSSLAMTLSLLLWMHALSADAAAG